MSRPVPIDIDLQTCLQTSKLLDDLFRPGERWSGDHGMGGNVFDEPGKRRRRDQSAWTTEDLLPVMPVRCCVSRT